MQKSFKKFHKPIANSLDMLYNNRKVVQSGAKCTENHEKVVRAMLGGEFLHVVDAKNRIFIPAAFRAELGNTFVVTRSLRGHFLCFYSSVAWEDYVAPLKRAPRSATEDILRFLYRTAVEVTPDAQGRILLPQVLVDYAGLAKQAYVVGVGDYGEIWSVDDYREKVDKEDIADMHAKLEQIGF